MKRDLDLARQLLFDIENRGTDCSISVLRSDPEQDTDECVRHHLRLLIDAGLLKEVDRTSTGIPCVRLTHEGHELIELARSEARWREAKWVCKNRIGGLSLSVVQGLLLRWAITGVNPIPHTRRAYTTHPLRYARENAAYRIEPYRTIESFEEQEFLNGDRSRYGRVEPTIDSSTANGECGGIDLDGDGIADLEYDSSPPSHWF